MLELQRQNLDTNTFQPAINPISDELDNRNKVMQGNKDRWQSLYELGQKKKEDLELKKKELEEIRELEEKEALTFRP